MPTVLAVLLFACIMSPTWAQDTSEPPVLGQGAHSYAWVPGWGKPADGSDLGNTHGCMAVDEKGRIYVNTDTERAVVIFSPDGKIVGSWGPEFKGGLHGMTLVKEKKEAGGEEEFLYLAHTGRQQVIKTTLDGETLWTLGIPEASGVYEKKGQYRPTSVAVGPDGDVYVADGYGLSWVHQFDRNRKYIRSWGGKGKEPGKFRTCHGMIIDTRKDPPTLLVADRENHRLQEFDLEGKHLAVVEGMLRDPCNMALLGSDVVVADLAGRVTILDESNELVAHLGDQPDPKKRARNGIPKDQWKDGHFLSPHSACWDRDGNLYVMDWNRYGRITKLARRR